MSICAALLALGCMPAAAETIHRWTDAGGVTHYSDRPPDRHAADHSTLHAAPAPESTALGLRPEERAALQRIDRRRIRQRHEAERERERSDRGIAQQRRACREHRARQDGRGYHPARRVDAIFLRRNCW
ncbi:MAG: DUF4124 domain-containing protein [Pseudomonadota bacterium]